MAGLNGFAQPMAKALHIIHTNKHHSSPSERHHKALQQHINMICHLYCINILVEIFVNF